MTTSTMLLREAESRAERGKANSSARIRNRTYESGHLVKTLIHDKVLKLQFSLGLLDWCVVGLPSVVSMSR